VPSFGALESLDEAHLEAVLQTNLLAPILLTRLLLPVLQARRPAAVLNVGSTLGRLGLPGYSAYCAAKFGLRGFSESLRRELAGSGVHVQYLGPRATRTAFNDAQVEAFNQATGTASDPPEAVGAAVLRMLRDEAPERFLGLPEKLAVRLNGLVPRWLDGAFRRHAALVRTPAPNR
jgi:short-subunit dehydrogenase